MSRPVVEVWQGDSPVVLSLPHAGTFVPPEILGRLNARGAALADTDWHVDRLFDGLLEGATLLRATHHRYVIDVNRDPRGTALYDDHPTTYLVPATDFEGAAIWDTPPDGDEILSLVSDVHAPYHAALRAELKRVHALHGRVILVEGHSIRSHLPFLFEGTLPTFSIGTNSGASCAPEVERSVINIAAAAPGHAAVLNGRFKGGWITRHYGRPQDGLHAVQLEIAQAAYLRAEAPPWDYDAAKADALRPVLAHILNELAALAPTL